MRLQIRIVNVPYQLHAVCLQAQAFQRVFSRLFWLGHGAPRKGHAIVVARLACSVGGLSHREIFWKVMSANGTADRLERAINVRFRGKSGLRVFLAKHSWPCSTVDVRFLVQNHIQQ